MGERVPAHGVVGDERRVPASGGSGGAAAVGPSVLTPAQVGDIIRGSCTDIGLAPTCAGKGLIDCAAALAGTVPPAPTAKPKARPKAKPTSSKKKKLVKK